MTQNYSDVFGQDVVPPSEYGYQSISMAANLSLNWAFNNTANPTSKITDISASVGSLSITLPSAMDVSVGEDMLFRNIGSQSVIIKNNAGVPIVTVIATAATYIYLTDNTTAGGSWGVIHYGVGTSSVDAASLVGYGVKAIAASLNQAHPVLAISSGTTVDATYRAQLVNYTGGAGTLALSAVAVIGDDFFTLVRNSGTGTLTINPSGSETVDGVSTLDVQPGESLFLCCSGTAWFTVGMGRSIEYTFTQLILDVSTGTPFTLTSAQASNKLLTFIGNPTGAVTVIVPNVVSIYYLLNSCSTNQNVTVKTATGFGANVPQNQRSIVICDGTNVYSAQSVSASSTVSLLDGSVTLPSLNFASQTNSGIFKYSTTGVGFAVNGVEVVHIDSTGTTFSGTSPIISAKIGPDVSQQHTLPAVASDTIALLAATQALTNKTISADSNTLSGIAASSFVLSNASGNVDGSAAQKVIPAGAVVGTTDSQALTNKTIVAASNTITTAASGNLAATELNAALAELQSEKVAKAGDTMAGQLKGITPVSADDLTRKDYVDTKLSGSGPAFRATLSAPQSISPSSFRKVNFDVETFDTNSCFAGYAFTPNVAGYYQINGGVMGTLASSNAYLSIGLCFQRGSTIVSETRAESTSTTSFTWSNYATLSDVIYMNGTTDSLTMHVRGEYTFNIGTLYNEHMTFFSGSLIRAA